MKEGMWKRGRRKKCTIFRGMRVTDKRRGKVTKGMSEKGIRGEKEKCIKIYRN